MFRSLDSVSLVCLLTSIVDLLRSTNELLPYHGFSSYHELSSMFTRYRNALCAVDLTIQEKSAPEAVRMGPALDLILQFLRKFILYRVGICNGIETL